MAARTRPTDRKIVYTTRLSESVRGQSKETKRGRVYEGVTLIRSGLGNRRDRNFYPPSTLKSAVESGKFEGLRAFADHQDSVSEEIQPERTIRDLVGVYENTRWNDKKRTVEADLRILGSQRWLSDTIDELIDIGHADKVGLSINGRGHTVPSRHRLEEAGGEEIDVNEVKEFIELRSTDIVTEAGAGGGFTSLLESARRAKETRNMNRSDLAKAIKEAREAGDTETLDELRALLNEDDASTTEGCGKRKKMAEAKPKTKAAAKDEDDDADDMEEGDDDPERDLDEAVDGAKEGTDHEDVEDDEDEDDDADVEEAEADEDDGEDVAPSRANARSAAERMRKHAASREAAITGAVGKPTGKVTSGAGKFVTPERHPKKASKVPGAPKKMKTRESASFEDDDVDSMSLREANQRLRAKNARLSEALRIRTSADRAKKLLRESGLPAKVRPTLVARLIGKTDEEMREEIDAAKAMISAVTESVKTDLFDGEDLDDIEGAGSTLRESFRGRDRDSDGGFDDVFTAAGLPTK